MGAGTLTVISVFRSGGEYDAIWVGKLERAIRRNLSVPHRFVCLSDSEVPCERIPLEYNWPGWWSKIELFRPGVINGPTLYCDLDNVVVGSIDTLADLDFPFAMTRNLNNPSMGSSTVMWWNDEPPHHVYETFREAPEHFMGEYGKANGGTYIGDQAFIWDVMDRKVPFLSDAVPGLIRSYRRHCQMGIPKGCSVIAFGGPLKPNTVSEDWLRGAWN